MLSQLVETGCRNRSTGCPPRHSSITHQCASPSGRMVVTLKRRTKNARKDTDNFLVTVWRTG
jgi:hypothetical protein